jgi:hypothetical protein
MNLRTSSLLATPFLLALAPLAPLADDVSFRPEPGVSLTKRYGIEGSIELTDLTAIVDGQDMSEMIPLDVSAAFELSMLLRDQYVRSGDGRPLELVRTFLDLSADWEAMGEAGEVEDFDALEDSSIRFVWNEDEEDYDAAYEGEQGDPDALDDFDLDMDLLVLLPEGQVEVGDTWTVEGLDVARVFAFGNQDSEIGQPDDPQVEEMMGLFEPYLDQYREAFKLSAEYLGRREQDGRELGAIRVVMNGRVDLDLRDSIERAMSARMPEGFEIDLVIDAAELTMGGEGEGLLLWDLAAGIIHSYEMSLDLELTIDVSVSASADGESHDAQVNAEILGDATWTVVHEAE